MFYFTFDNPDTIILRVLLGIKFQDLDNLSVEIKGGRLLVEGRSLEGFNIDNVTEFAHNNELKRRIEDSGNADEIRNDILRLSMRMSYDIAKGKLSSDLVEAYRLLERGNADRCRELLGM